MDRLGAYRDRILLCTRPVRTGCLCQTPARRRQGSGPAHQLACLTAIAGETTSGHETPRPCPVPGTGSVPRHRSAKSLARCARPPRLQRPRPVTSQMTTAQPRISGYLATTDTAADWGRSWLTVYQLLLPARAELIGACGRTCTPCQNDADRRDSCGGKNSSHSRQVADHGPYSQHRYGCATEPPRPFRYRRASCAAHQY